MPHIFSLQNSNIWANVETSMSGLIQVVRKKKLLDRTWLCAEISPFLFGLQTWSKCQKMRHVLYFALEKIFFACG